MNNRKRSPVAAVVLAVVIGLLVIALLNGVVRPTQVVVVRTAIASGTILSSELLELRTIPRGAVPGGAFRDLEEVEGRLLAVSRAPGDILSESVLGEEATAGLPAELPAGHVAMAVRVDAARAVAGLLRVGQTVTVIGLLSPEVLRASSLGAYELPIERLSQLDILLTPGVTPTPVPTATPAPIQAPLARIAITGLRVLLVPQSFRYEELPPAAGSDDLFSAAQASRSLTEGSVIVLQVPTAPLELTPGFFVSPAALLAALDAYGSLHLALEPAAGLQLQTSDMLTLNLGQLYEQMNAAGGE